MTKNMVDYHQLHLEVCQPLVANIIITIFTNKLIPIPLYLPNITLHFYHIFQL